MEEESAKTLDVAEPIESDDEVLDTQEEQQNSTNSEEVEMEFDESTESEESNDSNETNKENTEKNVQSSEENAKYAAMRREKEMNYKYKIDEAYKKGQLDAYKGKINPYTQTEIKDVHDIKVYQNMYNLDKEGKNPIEDYASYIADKEREDELNRIDRKSVV